MKYNGQIKKQLACEYLGCNERFIPNSPAQREILSDVQGAWITQTESVSGQIGKEFKRL